MVGVARGVEAAARRLRELRMAAGMTQEALAEACGISDRALRALESGKATNPRQYTLEQIARAVGLDAEAANALFQAWRRPGPVTAQLPADQANFVGRQNELDQLTAAAADHRLLVLSGPGGVGKTALAVRFAHQLAARFPDGQLYLDLRGFSPGSEPMEPLEAVLRILRAYGVDRDELPDDLDDGETKLRSVLAGRKVLLVLDNARSADQVRPLIPGATGSLALVTSRSQLRGLVVQDSAHRVGVDQLPSEDALTLVRQLVGESRPAAEPEAAEQIVAACDGLPLALRIVGELVERRGDQSLVSVADDLRDTGRRLDLLQTGEDVGDVSVRAVTTWSYQALSPTSARFFRMLGVHPGSTFTSATAAQLTGTEAGAASRELDHLASLNLVQQVETGRYGLHDLMRAYAAERASEEEPSTEVAAALDRLARWYLAAAHAAVTKVTSRELIRDLPSELPEPPVFDSAERSRIWLDYEWDSLMAALSMTAEHGSSFLTSQLAGCIGSYAGERRTHTETASVYRLALTAAQREGDLDGELLASQGLAVLAGRSGDNATCRRLSEQMLRLCGDGVSPIHRTRALNNLGNVYMTEGDLERAAEFFEASVEARASAGLPPSSVAIDNLGRVHWQRGSLDIAARYIQEATGIADAEGRSMAASVMNLAAVHLDAGRLDDAEAKARRAVELAASAGTSGLQAHAEAMLAEILLAMGRIAEAQRCVAHAELLMPVEYDADSQQALRHAAAACFEHDGDLDRALAEYRSCLSMMEDADERHSTAGAMIDIARVQLAIGQMPEAQASAQQALDLAAGCGFGLLAERARELLLKIQSQAGSADL